MHIFPRGLLNFTWEISQELIIQLGKLQNHASFSEMQKYLEEMVLILKPEIEFAKVYLEYLLER